jgi:hypothetical protein
MVPSRSTITPPGAIAATISAVTSRGAGRPAARVGEGDIEGDQVVEAPGAQVAGQDAPDLAIADQADAVEVQVVHGGLS